MHENLQQIILQVNAFTFITSNKGGGTGRFSGCGRYGGRSRDRGCSGPCSGDYTPALPPGRFHGGLGGYPGSPIGGQLADGPQPYRTPQTMPGQGFPMPSIFAGRHPTQAHVQKLPYSNIVKKVSNGNTCYSCGFDMANGHISMLCPAHLHKTLHDIHFNRQNTQQPCDGLGQWIVDM